MKKMKLNITEKIPSFIPEEMVRIVNQGPIYREDQDYPDLYSVQEWACNHDYSKRKEKVWIFNNLIKLRNDMEKMVKAHENMIAILSKKVKE